MNEEPHSVRTLADNLGVSLGAVRETVRRGLVRFITHRGAACWRFGDEHNGTIRRVDGSRIQIGRESAKAESTTKGDDWHRLIGLDEAVRSKRRWIVLVIEGSKDAMAAFHFADAEDSLSDVSIVTALGSAVRIREDELELLRGRTVRIIGDNDPAGREAVERIGAALAGVATEVQVFDLAGLRRTDGEPVKDLADVLRIHPDDFERERDLWNIARLDSKGSRVRTLNLSESPLFAASNRPISSANSLQIQAELPREKRQIPAIIPSRKPNVDGHLRAIPNIEDIEDTEYPEYSEDAEYTEGEREKEKKISPTKKNPKKSKRGRKPMLSTRLVNEAVRANVQPMKQLFALARLLKEQQLIHGEQVDLERECAAKFAKAMPSTADADYRNAEHVFTKLHARIPKVKVAHFRVKLAVDNALDSLSSEPPIVHSSLIRLPLRERLARVCRVLGRNGPFLLPVREASRIMGDCSPSTAHEHLAALERDKLLEVVERGLPSPEKRKATLYRYAGPV